MLRPSFLLTLSMLVLSLAFASSALALSGYQLFESGQVRPLALSGDGAQLFAVNTPDGRLEIFDVGTSGELTQAGSVQVGLEPVAVAVHPNGEVWVVNHLSDSVSIVALTPTPRVVRTLLVGDEPNDIVFAGASARWAFVTTAHRGQHSPNGGRQNRTAPDAPDASGFEIPGTPRADVWAFDTTSLSSELGGAPATVLSLFGDKPRALAVSNDGSRVYAAVFHSGNRTTVVNEGLVCDTSSSRMNSNSVQPSCNINGVSSPGGYPPPHKNHAGDVRPETGLIVKFDRPGGLPSEWSDELGRNWSPVVKFDLPDRDVFEIDASSDPPVAIDAGAACADGAGCWAGVGTILFNMAVNPVSGRIYVSNTDAQNHVRFEGPGTHSAGSSGKVAGGEPDTVQGNLAHSRITVLDGANVDARHLNKHLDYSVRPAPASDKAKSLATPLGMAVSADGLTLYVAAFGSNEIGVYDTAELESDGFDPDVEAPASAGFVGHIPLGGGGPTGLVIGGDKLYVMTRFDNAVRVVDTATQLEEQSIPLHNPEPAEIVEGRPFLYDARLTSSNGEASCSSCHIFGDLDSIGWDLGNPDDDVAPNGNSFNTLIPPQQDPLAREFHPSKGPMTTQSLRGLENMGPQHWRGDRQGDEVSAFEAFNVAFPGLVGRDAQLSTGDMARFRAFALALRYPPNPVRRVDNTLRSQEVSGFTLYVGRVTDAIANCHGCHTLDPANGHFGGNGQTIFDGEPQHMKIPHLRNQYQKVGMFGMSEPGGPLLVLSGDFSHQGPQIRGFGYLHDGSIDSLGRFFGATGFSMDATEEAAMWAYSMAFDTDFAPAVGQQVTLNSDNRTVTNVGLMISLLIDRAKADFVSGILGGGAKECDLVAKVVEAGRERGYLFDPSPGVELFMPDDEGAGISDAALRDKALVSGQEVTYTCVPPGAGHRMALDRDEDTLLDGFETNTGVFLGPSDTGTSPALADTDADGHDDAEEVAQGTDPTNPLSYPGAQAVPGLALGARAVLGALILLGGAFARNASRTRSAGSAVS